MEFTKPERLGLYLTISFSLVLASCTAREEESSANGLACDEKAQRKSLDNGCVVEIAKQAISQRLPGVTYPNYKVTFDPTAKVWIVMAFDEHGPPDNHTLLQIGADGKIDRFSPDQK